MKLLNFLLLLLLVPVLSLQGAQFTLSWTDNSTNETGFRIERAIWTNGVQGAFSEINTVGVNVQTYVDTGLPNSTTYSYRVRAYNSAGNSGYSNIATGTTPPPANTAPTITTIVNQTGSAGFPVGPITFTVADSETAAGSLTVTGSSSNTALFNSSSFAFGGTGGNRTLTLTPVGVVTGSSTITITVSDGSLTATRTFTVTMNMTVPSQPTGLILTDG
jgi:hypothetical protein